MQHQVGRLPIPGPMRKFWDSLMQLKRERREIPPMVALRRLSAPFQYFDACHEIFDGKLSKIEFQLN